MAGAEFVAEPRPYTHPDVLRMVEQVQAEYVRMYGGPDAAAVDPDEFAPPTGLLLVGYLAGAAVAMGGWRRLHGVTGEYAGATAEIKRMYVEPAARRQGLARLVLADIERTAAAAGVRRLVLSTGVPQYAAIALYRDCGYESATPFGYYADEPTALFLARTLSQG